MKMDSIPICLKVTSATISASHSGTFGSSRNIALQAKLPHSEKVRSTHGVDLYDVDWEVHITEGEHYNESAARENTIGYLRHIVSGTGVISCIAMLAVPERVFLPFLEMVLRSSYPESLNLHVRNVDASNIGIVWDVERFQTVAIDELRLVGQKVSSA